ADRRHRPEAGPVVVVPAAIETEGELRIAAEATAEAAIEGRGLVLVAKEADEGRRSTLAEIATDVGGADPHVPQAALARDDEACAAHPEGRAPDRLQRAVEAAAAARGRTEGTTGDVAGEGVAPDLKISRQTTEIVDEEVSERLHRVEQLDGHAMIFVEPVGE